MFAADVRSRDLISASANNYERAVIEASADEGLHKVKFRWRTTALGESFGYSPSLESVPRPVFIPSVDMLAHTKGFLSTWELYNIDFDVTYRDIVLLLLSPEKREIETLGVNLETLTGGLARGIQEQDERFFVETSAGRFAAPMVAEGVRKFATVVQLIKNGWIRTGTTLFWDEPEVSVNPSLMQDLAKMILILAGAGVQIFLATHSYVLLKELDLQANSGDVKYFALELMGNEVAVHPASSYDELSPNKIAEAFDSIYDRQLARATGRWRKNGDGR